MPERNRLSAEIAKRPVLTSFHDYDDAQHAVDKLSDAQFPVQHVAIMGVDLKLVESVIGRMSWGRAALSGMATFSWFGVLVGLFVSFFGGHENSLVQMIFIGLLFGAAFGIIFGLVSYAISGGKRDFTSRQALQADRYDLLCEAEHLAKARQILELGPAWPPPLPSPEQSATDGETSGS